MLKAKNYKAADKYFDQRLKLVPKDEKAHYYKAVCAHYAGDKVKARELYQYVVNNFPSTDMATKATNSLKKMDEADEKAKIAAEEAAKKAEADAAAKNPGAKPAKPNDPAKPAKTTTPTPVAALPTHLPVQGEARVHFDKIENDTVFNAVVNGMQTPVNFDPASEKNWIPITQFPHFGLTGNGPEWKVKVQVGNITKTITAGKGADWEPRPKFGMPFLEDLEYEVDPAGSYIIFRGANEKNVASDLYTVPFRRQGKTLL